MSTANNSHRTKRAVASTQPMARRPRKIKPGSGPVRVNFLIDAELLRRVDDEAERMSQDDPYRRATSRTDALRSLIEDGLKSRAKPNK